MHILRLDEASAQLSKLVLNFRKYLIELNKGNRNYTINDAIEESNEYFTPNRIVFGLFLNTDLIGFAVLKIEDNVYWLDWIYIEPKYRGFTNASTLFDFCEKYAQDNGCDQLYIWVHPNNNQIIHFLKKKNYNILNLIEIKKDKSRVDDKIEILGNEFYY